jgi:hypothetical protein
MTTASMPMLMIEHAVTCNMDDGQSLPPIIEDGVVWHAVCPLPGARTLWRRISLQPSTTLPGTAAARPRNAN